MKHRHIGNALLVHGDCLEQTELLQDADAVITDPPYGMGLNGISGSFRSRWTTARDEYLIEGDDQPFDPTPWLHFPKVILWGANHYASRLPDGRKWIIWDKREGTTPDNQADCDMAWTNLPGPSRIYRQLWRGCIRAGEENGVKSSLCHPTQKAVGLMKFCIQQCDLPTRSLIVDPYMGSGTTGVAAIRMGHRFIGVELVKKHFERACKRIAEETKRRRLPLEASCAG
jgi:site-specific DNA-methyltransferase (adenine-specific)/modification methylase